MRNYEIFNALGQYLANYNAKDEANALAKYFRDFPGSPRDAGVYAKAK